DAGVRVPMREIALTGHEPPVRVYDTSGPKIEDVESGLPALRRDWILARGDVNSGASGTTGTSGSTGTRAVLRAKPGAAPTQLAYARRGEITPEMHFIAVREGLPADFVRSEVARGRAI